MLHCKNCVTSVAKGGLCQHSVAVAETQGTLLEHIQRYRKQKYLESRLAYDNAPKGAGAKKRQKKPRRGQNNVEQLLILSKEDANEVYDPDLDVLSTAVLRGFTTLTSRFTSYLPRITKKQKLANNVK